MPTALLTGSHGFIGKAFAQHLRQRGWQVIRLVRHPQQADDDTFPWDPTNPAGSPKLPKADALIHLAGANIAARKWSPKRKHFLQQTRRNSLLTLAHLLQEASPPPPVLIVASAVGYYGYNSNAPATEATAHGRGFAAELCQTIENTLPLLAHTRVAYARFGIVLGREGGALGKMLPAFRLGLGGRLGNGQQAFPWISLDDACRGLMHILDRPDLSGPVNLVAPAQDTNQSFTTALCNTLHRPGLLPMPAPAARFLFGQMAEELLLNGTPVVPEKLLNTDFTFKDTDLPAALHRLL